MITCTSCGTDVTGKKFCPQCGTPVHAAAPASVPAMITCPRCAGEVPASASFCMHCGTALKAQAAQSQPLPQQPSQYQQPYQQSQYDPASQQAYQQPQYTQPQYQQYQQYQQPQYDPSQYQQPAPYSQYNQSGYQQPYQQYQQPQYGQPQYQQQYNPQYGQPQYNQGGYPQQPMTLRCPVCMAMAPIGTPNCPSCHTSLAGIVPTPANMAPQGQQGGLGGFFQGNNGKMAMGALGGAAAVLGGEMLLHGIEGSIENGIEGDMGYGYERHHHHRREEGLLGGLGDIANDLGL